MFLSEDYLRQKKSVSHHVRLIGLNDTKEYKMKILPWTKIIEIKQKIGKEISIKPNLLRIFYNNVEMIDKLTALDYQILNTKDNIIYYKCKELKSQSMNIQIYGNIICSTKLSFIIEEIKLGFQIGFAPSIIKDGTSGTYQMKDSNQNVVALFKPIDEEAFAPNNNKGYEGKFGQQSFRKGILSGEGNIREVVACIVDNDGFLRVPDTTFVEVTHKAFSNNRMEMFSFEDGSFSKLRKSIVYNFMIENLMPDFQGISIESDLSSESEVIKRKYGSLQKFINNSGVAADYGYNMFLKDDIHRIGILDLRILNCDRNDENILVIKKKDKEGKNLYKLIPIDHALSFPDCIEINEYEMCWMGWEQSQEPFSQEIISYINNIDILEDLKRISNNIKMRQICLKNFRIANTLLKIAVNYGLTLYEIGMLIYRPEFDEVQSQLEIIIEKVNKINPNKNLEYINHEKIIDLNKSNLDIEESKYNCKSTIIDNNQLKYTNSIHIPNKIVRIKRSFSEPKLSVTEDENSVFFSNDVNNKYIPLKMNEIKIKNKLTGKLTKLNCEKMIENNENEEDDNDSPYNENFFNLFKKELLDYLHKNFPQIKKKP